MFNNYTINVALLNHLTMFLSFTKLKHPFSYITELHKIKVSFLSYSFNVEWIPVLVIYIWHHKLHLQPSQVIPEYNLTLYFKCQSLEQFQLYFYIYLNNSLTIYVQDCSRFQIKLFKSCSSPSMPRVTCGSLYSFRRSPGTCFSLLNKTTAQISQLN